MKLIHIAHTLTRVAFEHETYAFIGCDERGRLRHVATPSAFILPVRTYPGVSIAHVRRLLPDMQAAFNRLTRRAELPLRYDPRDNAVVLQRSAPTVNPLPSHLLQVHQPHHAAFGTEHGVFGHRAAGIDLTLPEHAHLLVAGTTGAGKSMLMRVALATLLHATPPQELEVYLIDMKNRGLAPFAAAPHAAAYVHEPDHALAVIRHVFARVERRRDNVEDCTPRLLVVADEFSELTDYNRDSARYFRTIGRLGRELNVHLWLSSQKPTMDVIDSQLRQQLAVKLVGRVETPQEAQYIAGRSDTNAHLLPVGRGEFVCVLPGSEPRVVNGFYLDQAGLDDLLAGVQTRWADQRVPPLALDAAPVVAPAVVQDARRVLPVVQQYWREGQMLNGGWTRCAERLGVSYAGGNVVRVRAAVGEARRLLASGSSSTLSGSRTGGQERGDAPDGGAGAEK